MSNFQPLRPSHRALVLALAIVVNVGIATFIDGLAATGKPSAGLAVAKPAAAARA